MKIRSGFVSNSSSSSFICTVCKREESGMDLSLSDCEMYSCVNNHTFCDDEKLQNTGRSVEELRNELLEGEDGKSRCDELLEMSDEEIREEYELEYGDDDRYDVPESMCPVCQFKEVDDADCTKYLAKLWGVDKKGIARKFKEEFFTYKSMMKQIGGDK